MKRISLILLLCLAGCSYRVVGNANGFIDREYIKKHNLSLQHVKNHEQKHREGYKHCKNRDCLMYPVCPAKGSRGLCEKCSPTTINWLKKQ